jgi:hypothetical protein
MEILVFGLIAVHDGYRQPQEAFVREPNELQPLDVRALAHLYNVPKDSSKLSSDTISSLTARIASKKLWTYAPMK